MKWKWPHLEAEFHSRVEPELRAFALDFDDVCRRWGMPEPEITCLGRTPEENLAVGGAAKSLHLWEVPHEDARKLKRTRAEDFSVRQYGEAHLDMVHMWFRHEVARRGGKVKWELIAEPHGTGPHIHLGIRREVRGGDA